MNANESDAIDDRRIEDEHARRFGRTCPDCGETIIVETVAGPEGGDGRRSCGCEFTPSAHPDENPYEGGEWEAARQASRRAATVDMEVGQR